MMMFITWVYRAVMFMLGLTILIVTAVSLAYHLDEETKTLVEEAWHDLMNT